MKHLFYLPAFLALTTVSVYAQDTGAQAGDLEQQPQSQSSTGIESQSQGSSDLGSSSQGAVDFTSADTDGNGELSVEEAQEALPDLIIVDINNDGVLNRSEAENALPGLTFEGESEGTSEEAVGEEEFDQIVSAMEEQSAGQLGAVPSESDSTGLDEEV